MSTSDVRMVLARPAIHLPRDRVRPSLGDLSVGQGVYVTPWSMMVDSSGRCWMNPFSSWEASPGGTCCMWVARAQDGFEVTLPPGETWSRGLPESWTAEDVAELIPVVAFRS